MLSEETIKMQKYQYLYRNRKAYKVQQKDLLEILESIELYRKYIRITHKSLFCR